MSEGILLPPIARGTLLDESARALRIDEATPQILAATDGERDAIVVQATLACLLWETLPHASWVGFYRRVADRELAVGPYQGPMGCLRIDFARGVCGACAREGKTQLVPDVHAFPGHIACDDTTKSELVLPVFARGTQNERDVRAVLDLDSRLPSAFSRAEADRIESLLSKAFSAVVWPSYGP
jgi:GAF domain-containing protein